MAILTPEETHQICKEATELSIPGNPICDAWFDHIKAETGKPNLLACYILSDVIYWWKYKVIKDKYEGPIEYEKKFKADKLQRSYKQLADKIGMSKRQVKSAVDLLENLGLVSKDFRTIKKGEITLSNVLYIVPNMEKIKQITYDYNTRNEVLQKNEGASYKKTYDANTEKRDTYTSNTDIENLQDKFLSKDKKKILSDCSHDNEFNSSFDKTLDKIKEDQTIIQGKEVITEKNKKRQQSFIKEEIDSDSFPDNLISILKTLKKEGIEFIHEKDIVSELDQYEIVGGEITPGTKEGTIDVGKISFKAKNKGQSFIKQVNPEQVNKQDKDLSGFSDETVEIINLWNEQPNLTTHRINARPYRLAAAAIERVLNFGYEKDKIERSIKFYEKLLDNQQYLTLNKLTPGHKVSLAEFIDDLSNATKKVLRERNINRIIQGSWLDAIYHNETYESVERLFRKPMKDIKYENTYSQLKERIGRELTAKEEKQIIESSEKFVDFFKKQGYDDYGLFLRVAFELCNNESNIDLSSTLFSQGWYQAKVKKVFLKRREGR